MCGFYPSLTILGIIGLFGLCIFIIYQFVEPNSFFQQLMELRRKEKVRAWKRFLGLPDKSAHDENFQILWNNHRALVEEFDQLKLKVNKKK